jgi:hypothetical protein
LNLQLHVPMQSVSITTKVVNWNAAHGEVYSIQHYVIKLVSDLQQVSGFLLTTLFYSQGKFIADFIYSV